MSIEVIQERDITPLHMSETDTLTVTWRDAEGMDHELISQRVTKPMVADKVLIVRVENEFGMKDGLGAIIGAKA